MALRRLLWLVCLVVLVDTTFYSVVTPLLPALRDELGLSKASAGVLAAAYAAGTLVGALPGGWLAARVGPRAAVITGLSLLGASSLVFGVGTDVVVLDLARFAQGVGGACSWAGALSWLVLASPPGRRGALVGTALGAGIAGALLGPAVGAVADATDPAWVFGSVVLVAAALIAWALRTPLPSTAEREDGGLVALGAALRRPAVVGGMWLVTLPATAFGVLNVLGALRLDALGAGSAAVAGTFFAAAALEAVGSPVVGRISDRHGRLPPIRAGLVASAVALCLLTLPGGVLGLAALVVVAAGAVGVLWAPAIALLSDAAEAAGLAQGFAFALVNVAWALGAMVGAGAGGGLAELTTDAVPLVLAAMACLATLVLLRGRDATPSGGQAVSP